MRGSRRTMPDSCVIVGHGPSLLEKRAGAEIDSHDFVVRLKRSKDLLRYPEIYGARADAVCGSWTIRRELADVAPLVWVFMDSRHDSVPDEEVERAEMEIPCRIERELCRYWNRVYRAMRTPYEMPNGMQQFDPLGHPHMSAGMHAIVYAAAILPCERITLAGFDNIETGTFTWSVTRGPDWMQYPDHRWDVEHELIKQVSDEFDVEIAFL